MNTNTKILLKENANISNEKITNATNAYNNGIKLLQKLEAIGLKLDSVTDWDEIVKHFTAEYPKAPKKLSLELSGVLDEFTDAENFYLTHKGRLRYEPITDQEIESIKENSRQYATSEKQIEVHGLVHEITDKLNKLNSLGIKLDANKIYLLNRVFDGDLRQNPILNVNQRELSNLLIDLK
jgi:hypothetical protein